MQKKVTISGAQRLVSIATKYNTDYPDVDETYLNPNLVPLTTTWVDQVKAVLKARQKHERAKMLAKQRTEISEAIEKRIQQIESDQSKWINNSRHIGTSNSLYSHQFRKRRVSFSSIHDMPPFWQKIYEPVTQNEQVFDEVLTEIDDEEWDTILKSVNEKSAAGVIGVIIL
ncbi:hypothetical protein RIR_jg11715.t1 [Rhizophagus irregularis DAOM 181602=DAOM 197198]|nr:hypothetical protein RIR_jg11715.t1 [Rhizophagus irregularis DAOM 181602=DAOM 197198]